MLKIMRGKGFRVHYPQAAERDMWLRDLASAVRAARRRWVRGWARFFA